MGSKELLFSDRSHSTMCFKCIIRILFLKNLKQTECTRLHSSSYYAVLGKTKDMINMGKVSNMIFLKQTISIQ